MDTLNKSYSTLLRVKDSFHNVVAILPRHNHQNHIIMSDLMTQLGLDNLFGQSNNAGTRKSLYKSNLFADCDTKKDKTQKRKEIRKVLDNAYEQAKSYVNSKNPQKKDIPVNFAKDFAKFYSHVYNVQNWDAKGLYDQSKTSHSDNWHVVMQTVLDAAKDTVTHKK